MKADPRKPLTYLCVPYTHPDIHIREHRYRLATLAAAWLMKMSPNRNVFSPITHSHPLHVLGGLAGDWKTWARIDAQYLSLSREVVVLTARGWQQSAGVTAELKIARKLKLPVTYLSPFMLGDFEQTITI